MSNPRASSPTPSLTNTLESIMVQLKLIQDTQTQMQGTLRTLQERIETTDRTFEVETSVFRRAFASLGINALSDGAGITEDDDEEYREVRPSVPLPRNGPAAQQEQSTLSRANEILRTIKILRGKGDMGVAEFIKQVKFVRTTCSEPVILLKLIMTEKVTKNAGRCIRYHNIETYEQLYQALRTQVSTPVTTNGCRNKLLSTRQGFGESVTQYSLRFRQALSELLYAVQAKHSNATARRIAIAEEEEEAIRTYTMNLQEKIGTMVIAANPKTLTEAQSKATDIELWTRDRNSRNNSTTKPAVINRPPQPTSHIPRPNLALNKQSGRLDQPLQKVSTATERKTPTARESPKRSNTDRHSDRNKTVRRDTARIHYIPGKLRHIQCKRDTTGRMRRFLLDTGAGVNLIIERDAPTKLKLKETRYIQLGRDKHPIHYMTHVLFLQIKHPFLIIPNDFPLIEDGIFGLPFLEKYQFKITNESLTLNGTTIKLQETPEEIEVQPGKHVHHIKIVDDHPCRVLFINTGKQPLITSTIESKVSNSNRIPQLIDKLRLNHVDKNYRDTIEKIIATYNKVFTLDSDPLPCASLTQHEITLKNPRPINIKSYRPSECHKTEINRQIQEMLNKNIIEPSDSPFNSPIWVVPKKLDASGKKKWRIDFRKLNEQTEQDAYPLPNADEIIQQLGNAKFFSALDLSAGFH
nr:uncharacterized protein LOC117227932 [Megalopta genalis]